MKLEDVKIYKGSKKSKGLIDHTGKGAIVTFQNDVMNIQIDIPASGSNQSGQFNSVVIIRFDKKDLLQILNGIISFIGDEIKQKFKFK